VLLESSKKDNLMFGFTGNYIKVETEYNKSLIGEIIDVTLDSISESGNVKVKLS
jgi:threonylcarbamoyladenosine tRNA methylthiotransferase MtaB